MADSGPVVLVVLDGWGIEEAHEHNGIAQAATPWYDYLSTHYPFTTLHTSGEHVGLPAGQMGNSEVGHTTIGAGTVIYQDLVRISRDAEQGAFDHNPAFRQAFDHANAYNSQLHIIGLLSEGGVHSHENHFHALLEAAKQAGVKRVLLHPILDGRDAPPTAGITSLQKLQSACKRYNEQSHLDRSKHVEKTTPPEGCAIATVMGRYWAMDRDKNWDRTDKAWQAIANGQAKYFLNEDDSLEEAIQRFYDEGMSDEHIEPIVLGWQLPEPDSESGTTIQYNISPNDAVIFTNFRTDRTKQLSKKIGERVQKDNLCFVTMTDYGSEVTSIIAYEPQTIENTIASVVAKAGLPQAHIAETEKYPHATYFLNGGKETPHEGEEQVLIPSRKDIKTHDEAPEMMAKDICDAAIERLGTNRFLFINFANADMVGHTAKRQAIITAVETVDRELKRLCEAVVEKGGELLVIADHGNAERMVDPQTGQPHTSHTTNVVPCILISNNAENISLQPNGGLKDIAPTILALLDLPQPASMTGENLIQK